MKNLQLLLLAFTFLAISNLNAQKPSCLVVTANRDTLSGIFVKADEQLTILQMSDRQRIELQPGAIYEYALLQPDGSMISYQFIKHPKTGRMKPMRRLVDGYYKLFLDKEPSRSSVNLALPKNSSVPSLTSVYYLASYSEDAVEVSPKLWETVLKTHLADCAPVLEHIDRKHFKFKDLPSIVASYNAYVRQTIANERKADSILLEK